MWIGLNGLSSLTASATLASGERRGGKVGRRSPNKTPVVAAVSTNDAGHPLHLHLQVVKGFRSAEILKWSRKQLAPGSTVYSDGLPCFRAVMAVGLSAHPHRDRWRAR